jgi:hypothetical protein
MWYLYVCFVVWLLAASHFHDDLGPVFLGKPETTRLEYHNLVFYSGIFWPLMFPPLAWSWIKRHRSRSAEGED